MVTWRVKKVEFIGIKILRQIGGFEPTRAILSCKILFDFIYKTPYYDLNKNATREQEENMGGFYFSSTPKLGSVRFNDCRNCSLPKPLLRNTSRALASSSLMKYSQCMRFRNLRLVVDFTLPRACCWRRCLRFMVKPM